ncbi:hypothetical protein D3C81_2290550 [compost metagenome]
MEFFCGVEHVERCLTAEHVIGAQHFVHVGILQSLVLERRAGEMRVDLGAAGDQRGGRIGVRQAD